MDLLLYQIRMMFRADPGFTIFYLTLSVMAGIGLGFMLGHLLFG